MQLNYHVSVSSPSEGEDCNYDYTSSSGKICSADQVCSTCPGEDDNVCQILTVNGK